MVVRHDGDPMLIAVSLPGSWAAQHQSPFCTPSTARKSLPQRTFLLLEWYRLCNRQHRAKVWKAGSARHCRAKEIADWRC
jgi:hypothetical protein